ncbi:MAG: DUF4625 domain-containing protein [Aureispira sp.]|nr:DUF4625 domain-containing protein [Aureispira sp.]
MKKLWFLSLLVLGACKKEIDTTAPVFRLLDSVPSVHSGDICGVTESNIITIYTGDTLVWEVDMSDDQGLSQYKIDIHENFDCHGHRSPVTNIWNVSEIVNISGTSLEDRLELVVPDNARAGNYHFQIRLLDESGNQGEVNYYSFKVKNGQDTIAPSLALTNTLLTPKIQKGEQLHIEGSLSDNLSLEGGKLELVYFTTSSNRQVAVQQDVLATTTSHSFSIDYTISTTLVDGVYDFYLYGYDAVGNVSAKAALEVTIN